LRGEDGSLADCGSEDICSLCGAMPAESLRVPAGEFEAGAANPQKAAGPDRHYFLRSARYDAATGFTREMCP